MFYVFRIIFIIYLSCLISLRVDFEFQILLTQETLKTKESLNLKFKKTKQKKHRNGCPREVIISVTSA